MDDLSEARYAEMLWNTPLSPQRASELLAETGADAARSLLDLGCGWGELLLRAVAVAGEGASGIGIDSDRALLERARAAAAQRGLAGPVRFVAGDAARFRRTADVVLCIGAAHAWGGYGAALHRLRSCVLPGGRLLFGDGFWAAPPTPAALEIFGDRVPGLDRLRAAAAAAGWRVRTVSCASQPEWDDFETSFRAGREQWAAAHPDDPRAGEVVAEMADRRAEYETVYRGVLGFAYLALEAPSL